MMKTSNVNFFRKKSEEFWNSLPDRSHDGNLAKRYSEQLVIHSLVNWIKPKKSVEFGYNVGHSSILVLDASDDSSKLYSFDIQETNGNLLRDLYPNFTFIHGDSSAEYLKSGINNVDFVLIDSYHSYNQVTKEINCIFPSLNIGGILYFDDTNGLDVYNAIIESKYYSDMEEISNWVDEQHLKTPFIEINGNFYRNKVIRIYKKVK